jgi:sugar (pentulose or hexulose) kinase
MKGRFLLGLDAGTSVVKAVLLTEAGATVAAAARRTSFRSPRPGWAEASMLETWEAAVATIREVLARAQATGSDVAAIGITGQMLGAWLIDAAGRPVREAILWNDGRTQSLIERLSAERPGLLSEIFRFSGCVMQQGCSLPIVRWLSENEPDVLARADRILCSKDWVRFNLTGDLHTDPSDAAVLPGNTRTQDFEPELFRLLGVEKYRHLFPPLAPSEAVVGSVTVAAARTTGLRAGTPVVTGAGDVPAVALGAGAVRPGQACTILGTTCMNFQVLDEPVFAPADIGLLFYVPGHRWLRAFANIAGTTNLDWFAEQFCADLVTGTTGNGRWAQLEGLLTDSPVGARGVLYHPYLSAVGILAPIYEPTARAQFLGLSTEHRRADLMRAVYEGVALAIRDCYAVLGRPVETIRLSGGGARSEQWSQLIADCTGSRVEIPSGEELGAKGAALLAGTGIGWFASPLDAAAASAEIARVHEPSPANAARYDHIYEVYVLIRDQLLPGWQKRARLEAAI